MRRAYARKSCSFALAILCAVLWLCYSPRLRKLLEESGMARLISIREEPQLLLGELGDDRALMHQLLDAREAVPVRRRALAPLAQPSPE